MTGRRLRQGWQAVAVAAMVAAAIPHAPAVSQSAGEYPQRIVSANLCTDQLLLDLVAPGRIAAVTHLATDPLSTPVPEKAVGLAATDGSAESVLGFDPDLVLVTPFTSPATVALLRRLGRRVEAIPLAQDFAGIRAAIRAVAHAVGDAAQGETLISAFDARLAAEEARIGLPSVGGAAADPSAAVYQVNNYVSGTTGIVDEALRRAGFRNHAQAYGGGFGRQVSLEEIVASPPDLLVLASGPNDYATTVSDNLRHPVLHKIAARVPVVVVPWAYWLCGTHHIATAVERLGDARTLALARRQP